MISYYSLNPVYVKAFALKVGRFIFCNENTSDYTITPSKFTVYKEDNVFMYCAVFVKMVV